MCRVHTGTVAILAALLLASLAATVPRAVAAELPAVELPRDFKLLDRYARVTFRGEDKSSAVVEVTAVVEPFLLHVQPGTSLRPTRGEQRPVLLVWKPVSEKIVPAGDRVRRMLLEIVNAEHTQWTTALKEVPLAPEPAFLAAPDALRFLAAAREAKASWPVAQSGFWVLQFNLSLKEFCSHTVAINVYNLDTGHFLAGPLAGYREFRHTGQLFEKLGLKPADYRLFQDQRAQLEKALRELDFEHPGVNQSSMLTNNALAVYAGEPEVEKLLLRYVQEHPRADFRERAIRSLRSMGLSGTPDTWYPALLATPSREYRYLLAYELSKAGDGRGLPVIASLAADPFFAKHASYVMTDIRNTSKTAPQPGESAYAFWQRAIGWQELEKRHGDLAALRKLTEQAGAAPDPWLTQYTNDVKTGSEDVARNAVQELERRYAGDARVAAVLQEAALTHASASLRIQAGDAIVENFAGVTDLAAYLDRLFATEKAANVLTRAVRQSIVFGKLPEPEKAVARALADEREAVRDAALNMLRSDAKHFQAEKLLAALGPDRIRQLVREDTATRVRLLACQVLLRQGGPVADAEAAKLLLAVAAEEKERTVRRAAWQALRERNCREVLPLLKQKLAAGSREEKNEAVGALDSWGKDPETLAILEAAQADPDVGTYVRNVLNRLRK